MEGFPPMPPLETVSLLSQKTTPKDELSGSPATFRLTLPGGLKFFYNSTDTATLDYATLVHIAPLLVSLKEEESAGGSSGERAIRAVKVRAMNTALAEQCGTLARERNLAKQYDIANPASLRYLRVLATLHGDSSVDLIPGYLALAESCMGLGAARASSASEMLFTASSILMTASRDATKAAAAAAAAAAAHGAGASGQGPHHHHHHHHHQPQPQHPSGEQQNAPPPSPPINHHNALRSRLQVLYGRLYLSQGKAKEATEALAKAVYAASLAGGPEHLGVALPMYLLGSAFLRGASQLEQAHAAFDRVLAVYNGHALGQPPSFAAAVGYTPPPRPAPDSVDAAFTASPPGAPLSPLEDSEAQEALGGIIAAREAKAGALSAFAVAEAQWTLAGVHAKAGRKAEALDLLHSVIASFTATLGESHDRTVAAQKLLASI